MRREKMKSLNVNFRSEKADKKEKEPNKEQAQ